MAVNPAVFGFAAEYRADPATYDGFDEYLRIEFPKRHPGWEPRFGQASWVTQLLEEIAHGFKALRPDMHKMLAQPITKVWRHQ